MNNSYMYALALDSGYSISANAGSFLDNTNYNVMNFNYSIDYYGSLISSGSLGNWIGVTDKYLGVKFDISGETHYGWIRLDVNEDSSFIVKDFAYEATPNTGILAGDQGEDISCAAPTDITVDTITENSVSFSWTASPDETDGYDWAVFAEGANMDTDMPIATGSAGTGILNATAEGLAPETAYDIYVQTKCTSETSSDWEGPQTFTTEAIPCAAPTDLTVDTVTENSVSFSWAASPDETDGYDWALFAEGANIDNNTPIVTGTVGTCMLNATAEGLDPETAYDIYVQTKCTSETFSDWEGPQTFTTHNLSTRNFESLDDLSLYPNPVSSILTIESKSRITAIEIYNLLGQKVYHNQVNKINPELDISILEKGTHFIKIYKNKISKNFKIVKE